MLTRILLCATLVSRIGTADTITLKSGRSVQGTYLGGDARQVRLAVADRVDSFDVNDISEIRFGGVQQSQESSAPREEPRERVQIMRPERTYPPARAARENATRESAGREMEIPAGTQIVVRMIDDVDSERARLGQTFRASVDEPVAIGGDIVIQRGADVIAKLVNDKESGKLSGKTELTLDLQSVHVNGRMVDIDTGDVSRASDSRGAKTGKVVGGTAALGAIIGAIAGGGRGAAIGAASGAAAGGAVQVMTKGQRVRIPSETRLTFTLQQPVRI